jgi:hypothetical protein
MVNLHPTSRQTLTRSFGIGLRARTSSRTSPIATQTASTGSLSPLRIAPRVAPHVCPAFSYPISLRSRFGSTNAALAAKEQDVEDQYAQDSEEAETIPAAGADMDSQGQGGAQTGSNRSTDVFNDQTSASVCSRFRDLALWTHDNLCHSLPYSWRKVSSTGFMTTESPGDRMLRSRS